MLWGWIIHCLTNFPKVIALHGGWTSPWVSGRTQTFHYCASQSSHPNCCTGHWAWGSNTWILSRDKYSSHSVTPLGICTYLCIFVQERKKIRMIFFLYSWGFLNLKMVSPGVSDITSIILNLMLDWILHFHMNAWLRAAARAGWGE